MPVNVRRHIPFIHIAVDLHIDGMLQIVLKDQIQITSCHGGIIGKRYIGNRKSVIIPLHDLDLRPKQGIIERRGHLADTSADPLNHFIINKYPGHGIPVIILDGIDGIIGRYLFSGIYDLSVHQFGCPGDILVSSLVSETEFRRIGPQQVRDIGQLMGIGIPLILHDTERHIYSSMIPASGYRRFDGLPGALHIQAHIVISGNHRYLGLALLNKLCILRSIENPCKNTVHHGLDPGAVYGSFDLIIDGLSGALLFIALQRRAGISEACSLMDRTFHIPVYTKFSQSGLHISEFTGQGDVYIGESLLPFLQLTEGFFLRKPLNRNTIDGDILTDRRRRNGCLGRDRGRYKRECEHKDQNREKLPSSFRHAFIFFPNYCLESYQKADHHSCYEQKADHACDDPGAFLSLLTEIYHNSVLSLRLFQAVYIYCSTRFP